MRIVIEAIVEASKEHVFECCTEPKHIVKWNFADESWRCPSASNDMRVGGVYEARMEARDGSMGFDFRATYTNIEPGTAFTYVLEDDREVSVRFEGLGDGATKTTVSFDAETQNDPEFQRAGWQAILDRFASYAASDESYSA